MSFYSNAVTKFLVALFESKDVFKGYTKGSMLLALHYGAILSNLSSYNTICTVIYAFRIVEMLYYRAKLSTRIIGTSGRGGN